MMKSILATILGSALALSISTAVLAAPAGVSPGQNKDAWLAYYTFVEPTGSPTGNSDGVIKNLGGAISGGFYGNTSNSGIDSDAPAKGHGVTPSISPGPQTLNSGGPGTGTSVGEFIQSLK